MKLLVYLDAALTMAIMIYISIVYVVTLSLLPLCIFLILILYYLNKIDGMISRYDKGYTPWKVKYNTVDIPIWKMIIDNYRRPYAYKCNFYGMTTKYGLTVTSPSIRLYTYTLTGNVIWLVYLLLKQSSIVLDWFKVIGCRIKRYMKSEVDSMNEYKEFRKNVTNEK